MQQKYGADLRIYPGSMELRADGYTYALGSRTVCTVGIGDTLEEAREVSLDGIKHIDGALWNRWEIGAEEHVGRAVRRMNELRG